MSDPRPLFEEEKKIKVPNLQLIAGGKPPGDGLNWLLGLSERTIFLVRDMKSADFNLGLFHFLHKTESGRSVCLGMEDGRKVWFDPIRFTQKYCLHEILCDGKDIHFTEEETKTDELK